MGPTDFILRMRAIDETGAAFNSLRANAERTSATIGKLAGVTGGLKSIFAGIGAGIGFGALSALTELPRVIGDIVDKAGRLVESAHTIGITTDALQELAFAGKEVGVTLDDLTSGLQIFGRNIGIALGGTSDLAKVLKANGVAIRDQGGAVRDTRELLLVYADLIKNARTEEEKLFLAQAGFGRGGASFVNLLDQGSAALKRSAGEAHAFGAVLEHDLLVESHKVGQDWNKLIEGMGTVFEKMVLGIVTDSAKAIGALSGFVGQAAQLPAELARQLSATAPANAPLNESGLPSLVPRRSSPRDRPIVAGRDFTRFTSGLTGADFQAAQQFADRSFTRFTSGLTGAEFKPTKLPPSAADQAAADQIKKVTDSLKFQSEQLTRTARDQFIFNQLQSAGVKVGEQSAVEIMKNAGALYDQQKALQDVITELDLMREIASDVFKTFVSDLRQGKSLAESLADTLGKIADKIIDLGINRFIDAMLGPKGTSTGGMFGGDLLGIFRSILGFAYGGEFTVGGAGGVDSRVVAFRATPGEHVRVTRPGQGGGDQVGHVRLDLDSNLLKAEIVSVSGPVAIEVFKRGQRISARRQELAG